MYLARKRNVAALADVLNERRDEIVGRFADRLYELIASTALKREDVIDSLAEFLDEVIAGIRADQARGKLATTTTDSPTARAHGRHTR